jgi:hypothetical protein
MSRIIVKERRGRKKPFLFWCPGVFVISETQDKMSLLSSLALASCGKSVLVSRAGFQFCFVENFTVQTMHGHKTIASTCVAAAAQTYVEFYISTRMRFTFGFPDSHNSRRADER